MKNMMNKFSLKNKQAIVTGGCGLIGREIVAALAQAGAKVYIADINENSGKKLAKTLKNKSASAEFVYFDITDLKNIKNNIENIFRKYGRIDIWVNNAYPRTADWGAKVEDVSVESWQRNIDMHLNSYALCSKYAAEQMRKKGGSIINMGSIYGVLAAISLHISAKIMSGSIQFVRAGFTTNRTQSSSGTTHAKPRLKEWPGLTRSLLSWFFWLPRPLLT